MITTHVLFFLCHCGSVHIASAHAKTQSTDNEDTFRAFKFVAGFFGLDNEREQMQVNAVGLSVVGAGFSRTGTKSLEAALLHLGHKIYDTRSMLENNHVARWEHAATQWRQHQNLSGVQALVQEMEAAGYTTTLDFPMNLFARAIAQLRPTAKVVMSVRPSEESWLEAWAAVNHILSIFVCRPWSWLLDMQFPKVIFNRPSFSFSSLINPPSRSDC